MVDISMPDPAAELALLRAALAAAEARATAVDAELSATKVVLAQHRAVVSTSEAVTLFRHHAHERESPKPALGGMKEACSCSGFFRLSDRARPLGSATLQFHESGSWFWLFHPALSSHGLGSSYIYSE